jgi:cell division transport system permease protein
METRFISRKAGLEELRAQMPGQASLFEGLKENPLPDAYELRLSNKVQDIAGIEALARRLASIPAVQDVEYGQQWLEQAARALEVIRLTGLVLGVLFFAATAFIVGNTIRLVIYSRRDEIEIMRLVGATDRFICTPFYFLGLLQGATGGLVGLVILLVVFWTVRTQIEPGLWVGPFQVHFLPVGMQLAMVAASMMVGCLGCFLSLQQFLKR